MAKEGPYEGWVVQPATAGLYLLLLYGPSAAVKMDVGVRSLSRSPASAFGMTITWRGQLFVRESVDGIFLRGFECRVDCASKRADNGDDDGF